MKTVVEILTAHIDEMRRTTDSIRKEGAADREILKLALLNHEGRIQSLKIALLLLPRNNHELAAAERGLAHRHPQRRETIAGEVVQLLLER